MAAKKPAVMTETEEALRKAHGTAYSTVRKAKAALRRAEDKLEKAEDALTAYFAETYTD